jgi:hypothetical protein
LVSFFSKDNKIIFEFFHHRYTSSKDKQIVYAFLLVWPQNTTKVILGAPVPSSNTIVTLLGFNEAALNWSDAEGTSGIIIDISNIMSYSLASDWAWVFKLQHISAKKAEKKSKQTFQPRRLTRPS